MQKIALKLNVDFEDLVEITPDRTGKDFAYQLESQKIRTELGWSDEVDLDSGIERTISWVRQNIDALQNLSTSYIHRR